MSEGPRHTVNITENRSFMGRLDSQAGELEKYPDELAEYKTYPCTDQTWQLLAEEEDEGEDF